MPDIESMISNAMGGIFGIALGGLNDERQYNQQERLQGLQVKGQKELTDYNLTKQLELWRQTNYPAQIEQLKKAGLNPALLYQHGGQGGTTGITQGSVSGAEAPKGGREVQDILQYGLQMQMQKAQIENINADTAVKKEQAPNVNADTAFKQAQTKIQNIDIQYLKGSLEDRLNLIFEQSQQAITQADIMQTQLSLDRQTREAKVTMLQTEIIAKSLEAGLTDQKITESKQQINKWAQEISQSWTKLTLEGTDVSTRAFQAEIQAFEAQMKAKYPSAWNVIGRVLNETAENIGKLFGQLPDTNSPKRQK